MEPGGRPGPGLPGFGAPAAQGRGARMFLNPRSDTGRGQLLSFDVGSLDADEYGYFSP